MSATSLAQNPIGKFWYISELAHMRGRLDRIWDSAQVPGYGFDAGRAAMLNIFTPDFQKRQALACLWRVRANRLALSEMGRSREIPSMAARLLGHAADCRRAAR